ncbi:hypothetical protein C1Y11_22695 [Pseudomonas sp. FW305-20]|nr:hypothetical protein C1Y11_22695 [Pseudomonas sp. FW305-20]PMU17659.1 hypothetical protein C1Y10_15570 [Pseudomonas sp. FW305-122]PMU34801.1 hypothetical protein C1Y12_26730 [Pseudomonas sp. FW305-47B]PMX58255.1 hypothetical protein C1Y13_21200 [Pseudomonas sp. FW305-33]PMX66863.1 hypothetical protein C1X12_15685 [Pseudomonas sp. FW305-60]
MSLLGAGGLLWRGSLLPLGGEAAPTPVTRFRQKDRINLITTAAQPSGSKLPRHQDVFATNHRGACRL